MKQANSYDLLPFFSRAIVSDKEATNTSTNTLQRNGKKKKRTDLFGVKLRSFAFEWNHRRLFVFISKSVSIHDLRRLRFFALNMSNANPFDLRFGFSSCLALAWRASARLLSFPHSAFLHKRHSSPLTRFSTICTADSVRWYAKRGEIEWILRLSALRVRVQLWFIHATRFFSLYASLSLRDFSDFLSFALLRGFGALRTMQIELTSE